MILHLLLASAAAHAQPAPVRLCGDLCELAAIFATTQSNTNLDTIMGRVSRTKDAEYWAMTKTVGPYVKCQLKVFGAKPFSVNESDINYDLRFQQAYDACADERQSLDAAFVTFVANRNPEDPIEDVTTVAKSLRALLVIPMMLRVFKKAGDEERFEEYLDGLPSASPKPAKKL